MVSCSNHFSNGSSFLRNHKNCISRSPVSNSIWRYSEDECTGLLCRWCCIRCRLDTVCRGGVNCCYYDGLIGNNSLSRFAVIVCFWGRFDHAFYNCRLVHKSFSAFYGTVSFLSWLRRKVYGVATNLFCRPFDN